MLQTHADKYFKQVKKLKPKYEGTKNENAGVFVKLDTKIKEFKESIPLIQMLKTPSILERHWKKLMKETGTILETSIKTLTLDQVFALNL